METENAGPSTFGIINLSPCGEIKEPKASIKPSCSKKPPCSPKKIRPQNNSDMPLSPSPTKKRTECNKENSFSLKLLTEDHPIIEQTLLKLNEPKNRPENSIKKKQTIRKLKSCTIEEKSEKKLIKSLHEKDPRPFSHNTKKTQKSFTSNTCGIQRTPQNSNLVTPERQRPIPKTYTPVLTEKKTKKTSTYNILENKYNRKPRKISSCDFSDNCKRISLFDSSQSKSISGNETCSSFKDQSTHTDDLSIGEVTPIKNQDEMHDNFPEQSFYSPLQTIHIISPPEKELEVTPEEPIKNFDDYNLLTPEIVVWKKDLEPKTPKKPLSENCSPNGDFFSLSSSSGEELISEVSFSEDVQPTFGENERLVKFCDKDIQTDSCFAEIFELLSDSSVIDGLKTLGKITEILKFIKIMQS
ncbi:hypothetical protein SteCoe_12494 [Stentor coeruleus]|uniref:Uncharacterized protein n=1 Tax=Stentor coeruleus TaxID=5963 RepID=A0A1R2CAM5_9CILI|nr:hypothetical protein SteCoe_12494 [Stentor coeruleus]